MEDTEIEAIEREVRNAQTIIKFADALRRLKKNKDFIDVVLNGYFKEDAIRLVHLKARPDMQSEESQKLVISQIDAIGAFSAYMNTAFHKEQMAKKTMEDIEYARDNLSDDEGGQ